jgi:hypothetical protein
LACAFSQEGRTHRGFVLNLSEGGIYLQTEMALPPGTELTLQVSGVNFETCDLSARVVRRLLVPGPLASVVRKGVGLELCDPPDAYLRAVQEMLGEDASVRSWQEKDGDDVGIEIELRVEELEEEPTVSVPVVEPEEDPREAPLEPEPEPEVEFSEEEWETLDPLGAQGLTVGASQSVLNVETLLVGDGDLDDVAILLDEIGVNPARMSAAEASHLSQLALPPRLVVVSARSAIDVRLDDLKRGGSGVALAVGDSDSVAFINQLRTQGFDYVVRRPVDPDALRLLLARLSYNGGERRGDDRTAIGCGVKLSQGFRRRDALLLEVSEHGCSLLGASEPTRGSRLTLRVPRSITGGRALVLGGRVVRVEPAPDHSREDRTVLIGLAFEQISERKEKRLAELIQDHRMGPARLERRKRVAAPEEVGEAQPLRDRRAGGRVALQQEILHLDESNQVARVLFGSNLSEGGLRIEAHPDLQLDDELDLAIYSTQFPASVRVRALVIRDEEELGFGLRFLEPSAAARKSLAKIVAEGPVLVRDSEEHGIVMTEFARSQSQSER